MQRLNNKAQSKLHIRAGLLVRSFSSKKVFCKLLWSPDPLISLLQKVRWEWQRRFFSGKCLCTSVWGAAHEQHMLLTMSFWSGLLTQVKEATWEGFLDHMDLYSMLPPKPGEMFHWQQPALLVKQQTLELKNDVCLASISISFWAYSYMYSITWFPPPPHGHKLLSERSISC